MGKQKTPTINLPTYEKPTPYSFNTPWGSANFSNNTWNINPTDQQTITMAQGIRSSLLKSLGLGGDISQDKYTQTYMNELLRLAQPRTENALIGRGLGGSSVYKDALTDLITKASNQAILGGQQYKMNDLAALESFLSGEYGFGQNLATLASGAGQNQEQLAMQKYLSMLPYTATYSGGKDYSGLGTLLGAGAGVALAPFTGGRSMGWALPMLLGAQAGGTIGRAF